MKLEPIVNEPKSESTKRMKQSRSAFTRIVSVLNFLTPDGVGQQESVVQESVQQVSRFRVGPAQERRADRRLLGAVAALEPGDQRFQLLRRQSTRRLRRRHHHGNRSAHKQTNKHVS